MRKSDPDDRVEDEDLALLLELLEFYEAGPALADTATFRVAHEQSRPRLNRLGQDGFIRQYSNRYYITYKGLLALRSRASHAYRRCRELLGELQTAYRESQQRPWTVEQFAERIGRATEEVSRLVTLLRDVVPSHQIRDTGFVGGFSITEPILDVTLPDSPVENIDETPPRLELEPRIESIEISGYRPFSGFCAAPGPLTVIIGANASGKSSLFDALRLLSYAVENPLPPEIDPRHEAGTMLFHAGGPEQIDLGITVPLAPDHHLRFEVSIQGPLGAPRVVHERLATTEPLGDANDPFVFLDFRGGKGMIRNPGDEERTRTEWTAPQNELALRRTLDPTRVIPSSLRSFVASWRSYSGFDVGPRAAMRKPAYIDESPVLAEDGSNLTAVLHALVLVPEHREAWEELEMHLHAVIPGFESLGVRPRGARGMAIGTWRERGVAEELTLGDLSEGTLRLLCWLALAFSPNLPPVVFFDEPELGLHPRVLPTLAGAFKLASARSQILIATHSPHFLSQFDLDEIAVMRKEGGHAVFVRPGSSNALRREVEELGGEALARLFISEELEVLP